MYNVIKEFIDAFIEVYSQICVIGGFLLLAGFICLIILDRLESLEKKRKIKKKKHNKV